MKSANRIKEMRELAVEQLNAANLSGHLDEPLPKEAWAVIETLDWVLGKLHKENPDGKVARLLQHYGRNPDL